MKVLIGTPIHRVKDYAMEKWLENVSRLEYPADLLLMDNSPDTQYVKQVKKYCAKYGIKNYKIKHIKVDHGLSPSAGTDVSQEIIRQYVLTHDYDAWFSWECDQIIPPDALDKLIKLTKGGVMVVAHNSWDRKIPGNPNFDMGCTLIIKKGCLDKYAFLLKDNSGKWLLEQTDDFYTRVVKGGGNYVEVRGLIGPILHL